MLCHGQFTPFKWIEDESLIYCTMNLGKNLGSAYGNRLYWESRFESSYSYHKIDTGDDNNQIDNEDDCICDK